MKKVFNSAIFPLILLVIFFISIHNCFSENISLDFNKDIPESPPQGVFSTGISSPETFVKIAKNRLRPKGDLSVLMNWGGIEKAPRMVIESQKGGFPSSGSLLLDFLVENHGAPLNIVGETNKGRTLFHVLVNSDGKVAARSESGDTIIHDCSEVQWYFQQLDYDFTKGVFSLTYEGCFFSGEIETLKLEKGEYFKKIVFYGEKGGASSYGLDSIYLVAAPRVSSRAKLSSNMPLGTLKRKIRWETVLLSGKEHERAAIVYPSGMKGGFELACKLRDFIKKKTGQSLPCFSDKVVTDSASWLLRDKFLRIPMIVMGNAVDNKAIYAVATKFLSMSNHRWPGADKFCNRSILEPFRRDVNQILLEASTIEGLEAAVSSFCKRLDSIEDKRLPIKYFRDLGAAKGEWKEKPFKQAGIDLSKSIEDIKDQLIKKYGRSVPIRGGGLYFYPIWKWLSGTSIEAAKYAAAVLLFQHEKMGNNKLEGHYCFDRTLKGWQLCFTSGAVDEKIINKIENVIARHAANPRDHYPYAFRRRNGYLGARYVNRHWLSSLSNYYCGAEYAMTHCRMNPITKAMVREYYQAYRNTATRFTDSFRDNNDTSEVPDSAVAMVNLMALTGNLEYVRNGSLANAADHVVSMLNNLGYYTGQSPYIGSGRMTGSVPGKSVLGAAAFYYDDPQYEWLFRHLRTVFCRTSHDNPVFNNKMRKEYPERYIGVHAIPFDNRIYRIFENPENFSLGWGVPTGFAGEQLFDNAVFRDGFEPEKAFLMLMGTQLTNNHSLLQSNAIIQYTDLGKFLLYTTSKLIEQWARNVVTSSNGMPSESSYACKQKALINSGDISAISSVNPKNGNSEWTRNIIHRKGHYFIVIDKLKPFYEDEYAFTCRWRTYYPQTLESDGTCEVNAGDGVKMRIVPADLDTEQESYQAASDGATSPYRFIQHKTKNVKTGETVTFKNMFYAFSPDRPDICDIKGVDGNSVVLRGKGSDWSETALIGIEKTPDSLKSLTVIADVYHINKKNIVAANCREIKLGGKILFSSKDGENKTLPLDGKDLGLDGIFDALKKQTITETVGKKNFGINEKWVFDDFNYPPKELKVEKISANQKAKRGSVESLIDDMVPMKIKKIRKMAVWRQLKNPLEITLDMGAPVEIKDIRLPSAVADGYMRRNYYKNGEMSFKVLCSDDNFKKDTRALNTQVEYRLHSYPRAQYTFAGKIPMYIIPINSKARYLRIIPETTKEFIAFQKVIVYAKEKNKNISCELETADINGDGTEELVAFTSSNEVLVIGTDGKKLWSRQFQGTISSSAIVDLEDDGKNEILVYTTDDKLFVINGNGEERFTADIEECSRKQKPDSWERSNCPYCFKHVTTWDSDGDGKKEIIGFGHTSRTLVSQDGQIDAKVLGGVYQPEKSISDSTVYGKSVFGGIATDFKLFDKNFKILTSVGLPAKCSGNNELPAFADILAFSNDNLKGFLIVNQVSMLFIDSKKLKKKWAEFSKVPITCCAQYDYNKNGSKELLLGYKDGFIRAYDISNGKALGKICTGSFPITGIRILRNGTIAVASTSGLSLYNEKFQNIGFFNMKADAMTVINSKQSENICSSDNKGKIYCFEK